jgi:hypothetical protein
MNAFSAPHLIDASAIITIVKAVFIIAGIAFLVLIPWVIYIQYRGLKMLEGVAKKYSAKEPHQDQAES